MFLTRLSAIKQSFNTFKVWYLPPSNLFNKHLKHFPVEGFSARCFGLYKDVELGAMLVFQFELTVGA